MLFLCLALGMILRRTGRVPENTHVGLNAFIINVSLPSLTLVQIHAVQLTSTLPLAALMPWLLFAVSGLIFGTAGHFLRLPRTTIGALVVLGGLGNTSFVGLPMIESFYGASGMPIGIGLNRFAGVL
jgi:malate permease and related proteins